jgi:hypothetical protein
MSIGKRDQEMAPEHDTESTTMDGNSQSQGEKRADVDGSHGDYRAAGDTTGNGQYGQSNGDTSEAPSESTQVFEVTFDGGDKDPDCPRSMGVLRKWMIVTVVSSGSFCV